MPRLLLVRHAQASFYGADYDVLSELGVRQAQLLGDHWARAGLDVARVFVGPRRRHAHTCAEVKAAFEARGLKFPEPERLAELDEHHGMGVVQSQLGLAGTTPESMAVMNPAPADDAGRLATLRRYVEILRSWALGHIEDPRFESWAAFRARVHAAMDAVAPADATGTTLVFTSGGVVSASAGAILGLDDGRIIDLHTVVRNTAVSEIALLGARRRLVDFNTIAHLATPDLATLV